MNAGVREAVADEDGEQSGASAEVEDVFRAGGNEIDGLAIEVIATGDEAGAIGVVSGGGGVEDCFCTIDHLILLQEKHK